MAPSLKYKSDSAIVFGKNRIESVAEKRYLHGMNESFDLPVSYNGAELLFPASLRHLGYTHTFIVDVNGQEVVFEPDEEQNYRALIDPDAMTGNNKLNVELLEAIAAAIAAILK